MSSPQYDPPADEQLEPVPVSNAQPPPRRIGIVGNLGKPAALPVARDAIAALSGRITVCVERQFADLLEMPHLGADDQELRACDLVLVFGGDGTVLGTSRMVAPSCTPMLGVNLGRFGFLNEVAPERVGPAMENLLAGNYSIEERLMLEAHVLRNGEVMETESALNEVVIGHSTLARVMHLSMSIKRQLCHHLCGRRHYLFHADGQHSLQFIGGRTAGASGARRYLGHAGLPAHAHHARPGDSAHP